MSNFNDLIKGNTSVLVDFYADWCGPCKTIAPILKEVKSELGDKLRIVKVNVDRNQQAAAHYGVRGVPTLILFQNGQQIWRESGVVPRDQLIKIIEAKTS